MSWTRRNKVAAAVAGVLVVLCGVAVALLPEIAAWVVVREARSRGVELEFDSLAVGWSSVRLRGVRFSLEGVAVLHGSAASMTVEHTLLSPREIAGDGLELSLEGTRVRELLDWSKRFPDALSIPASDRKSVV